MGILGFLISFCGSWIPSPWLDEAATAHIISYPFVEMAKLFERTDAVFVPYYLAMDAWTSLTGVSPFLLRLPSLLAVGVGTAAMAAAGHTIGGQRTQLMYAACFALLPRVTAMGIEARPYALSAMFMALALLAVVKLRYRRSWGYSLLLGAAMAGTVASQLFSVLAVIGLVCVAFVLGSAKSRLDLMLTAGGAGLVCLPLALSAVPQQKQVSWLSASNYSLADQAMVESWFTSRWNVQPVGQDLPLHYIATVLAILCLFTVVLALVVGRPLPIGNLAIAIVPPAVAVGTLWMISLIQEPLLLGRYLTSATPFIAMLFAESLLMLRPYARRILTTILFVGVVVLIVAQRQDYAKVPGQDYSFIASALHERASDGDGLLFEPGAGPVDSARNAVPLYPEEFARLVDIAQPQRAPLAHVFATDPAIADISTKHLPTHIWLVTKVGQDSHYANQLSRLGFNPVSSSSGPAHEVTLWAQID